MTATAEPEAPPLGAPVVKYSPTEAEIAAVKGTYADLIADPKILEIVRTPEGMARAKAGRKAGISIRTTIDKARLGFNADAQKHIKTINSEARRLTLLGREIEIPLHNAIETVDGEERARAEAIVQAEEEKEAELERLRQAERDSEKKEQLAERSKLAAERAAFEKEQEAAREQQRIAREEYLDECNRKAQEQAAEQKKLDDERDRIAAEEDAKRKAAEEVVRKREEDLARPDVEKVHREGEQLARAAGLIDVNQFKTAKSREFMGKVAADLQALAERCNAFTGKAGATR